PAPTPGPAAAAPRGGIVERVRDVAVLQLDATGFDALEPVQRILAYHLALAAIAGDPIAYDQRYARNLEIKALLEGIVSRGRAVDPDALDRIREYLKLFWIHRGIHDSVTREKTRPGFSFDELLAAALTAFHSGERLGFLDEDDLRSAIDDLAPSIFDPAVDRFSVSPSAPPGTVEQVYRAGREGVPPGLYARELSRVVSRLREALPYATEAQAAALGLLIDHFETGDPRALREYWKAWVADDPPIDAILGFVGIGDDPRSVKGTWEGIVLVPDRERTAVLRALAENAPYWEERMPWPESRRRRTFDVAAVTAAAVLAASGGAALMTPAAVSLPDDPWIRRGHGSRTFQFVNVDDAAATLLDRPAAGFAWDDEEIAEAFRCGRAAWTALAAVHDVVGHEAGVDTGEADGDPRRMLREHAGAVEEARADLVALRLAGEPRLVDLGLLPDSRCGAEMARGYVRGVLPLLRGLSSDTVEGDHRRAHLMIVRYAIERGAVREDRRAGVLFLRIPDAGLWNVVVGELLVEMQRVRVEGDYDAARALVETYGAQAPRGWREEARRRADLAGMPRHVAFLPPALEPIRGPDGRIVDVRAVTPVDFEALMLAWSVVSGQ
ncbi:MAG: hypothetical protein QME96_01715, partial [Myxococcota bacterium]|nr:hypothetical protein [Myxococcota bacterium]